MNPTQDIPEAAPQSPSAQTYINNPFMVALKGMQLLFNAALSVAVLFIVLSILSFARERINESQSNQEVFEGVAREFGNLNSPSEITIVVILLLLIVVLTFFLQIIVSGVADFTSAKLAKGEKTTLGQALKGVLGSFWSYAWLRLLLSIKILLWSLLLIIPGVVKTFRYSLAGVAFFDKKLRGQAAIDESISLTNGAWMTTFSSTMLLNIVTFGYIPFLITPGTNAILYRQFGAAGESKPKAHVLSWITVVLAAIVGALLILSVLVLVYAVFNYGKLGA